MPQQRCKEKQLPKPPAPFHRSRHCMSKLYYRYVDIVMRQCKGYHFGVLFCAMSCGFGFLINLSITIWAARTFPLSGGIGTLYEGTCSRTQSLSTWLDVGINALGTLLLGCSNYIMQCLSAPTREEIDIAHAQGTWLDIGILSIRNLRRISR